MTTRRAIGDGFVVGVKNPKTMTILVGLTPTFVAPTAGSVPLQLLVLGGLFPLTALVLEGVSDFAAGSARYCFARSPRRMAAIGGLVMIGIGIDLPASRPTIMNGGDHVAE